jgi:hypothetical protein
MFECNVFVSYETRYSFVVSWGKMWYVLKVTVVDVIVHLEYIGLDLRTRGEHRVTLACMRCCVAYASANLFMYIFVFIFLVCLCPAFVCACALPIYLLVVWVVWHSHMLTTRAHDNVFMFLFVFPFVVCS